MRIIAAFILGLITIAMLNAYPKLIPALGFSGIVIFIVAYIQAKRMVIYANHKFHWLTALKANACSVIFSYFTPGKTSEMIKPLYFKKSADLPYAEGTALVVVERIYDALTFFVLLPILAIFLSIDKLQQYVNPLVLLGMGIVVISLIVAIVFKPNLGLYVIQRLPVARIRAFTMSFYQQLQLSFKQSFALSPLFLSVIIWVGSWLSYWIFLSYIQNQWMNLTDALLIFVVGTLGLTFTIAPAGVGTYEAIMILLLKSYHYSAQEALMIAEGLRLINLLPFALIAVYVMIFEKFEFRFAGNR